MRSSVQSYSQSSTKQKERANALPMLVKELSEKYKPLAYEQRANEHYVEISSDILCEAALFLDSKGLPLVNMFCIDERKGEHAYRLVYTFGVEGKGKDDVFISIGVKIGATTEHPTFPSIARAIPAANWYEREVQDLFGLVAEGHPDGRTLLKHEDWPANAHPLRKDFPIVGPLEEKEGEVEYEFKRMEGEGVYEIPVGPVHAGIIEPGAFRFSVAGEPVQNLEIRLGYVHKGIEKLFESKTYDQGVYLAERVSGDNSVAHALAYCQAIERAYGVEVPERARYSRVLLAEMERIHYHMGDIAGVATDIAYIVGSAQANALRERIFRMNARITGARLLRGMLCVGGLTRPLQDEALEEVLGGLGEFSRDFHAFDEMLTGNSSVKDRIERAGILTTELAKGLRIVGCAARASGIDIDVRRDHPYASYGELSFEVPTYLPGDVNCRTAVKLEEITESLSIIEQCAKKLEKIGKGPIATKVTPQSGREAMGYVESPRGELIYWVKTAPEGRLERCKIKSPSFSNWQGLEHAILGNIVPDFPLCNKSFNLSYSGNDR